MDNLSIYNKYKSVPGNALKQFNNGKFSGTDINPMWRIRCLTEEFGPCGLGWYPEIVRLWTESVANDEVLAMAHVRLYVKYGTEWSKPIEGTGGNIITRYSKKNESLDNSDEGYKMAITDALSVCCKYLGIGASVWWDEEKTKYTKSESAGAQTPIKRASTEEPYYPLQTEDKSAEIHALSRKMIIQQARAKSGCSKESITNFMRAIGASSFGSLTDREFDDLLKLVKEAAQ